MNTPKSVQRLVTNGPWRDGKGHPYEGGYRVPFVAQWPSRIAPGSGN